MFSHIQMYPKAGFMSTWPHQGKCSRIWGWGEGTTVMKLVTLKYSAVSFSQLNKVKWIISHNHEHFLFKKSTGSAHLYSQQCTSKERLQPSTTRILKSDGGRQCYVRAVWLSDTDALPLSWCPQSYKLLTWPGNNVVHHYNRSLSNPKTKFKSITL